MPIYEFFCPANGRIYSFFARSLAHAGKTPRCPDDPKLKLERMISPFAVVGRAKEASADEPGAPPGEMDDARLESAMREMEREFDGSGDSDPDPKQLARMMRRLSEATGEKLPEPMKEMIARMEKGEDPEKLESEYGDLLDTFDQGDPSDPSSEALSQSAKSRRARKVTRDPTLYEMSEFVD